MPIRSLSRLAWLGLLCAPGCQTASSRTAAPGDLLVNTLEADQIRPILEKTLCLRLDPDLSHLSEGERTAVARLLEVGQLFQTLYEDSLHHQAQEAHEQLLSAHERGEDPDTTSALLDLYRLSRGPILRNLDNQRVPLVNVDPPVPGKNVYPRDLTKEEFDRYLDAHPERRQSLLHLRSLVRRTHHDQVRQDLGTLDTFPALDTLHPGLREELEGWLQQPSGADLYAVPYSVAWPEELHRAHDLLHEAAAAIESEDPPFARYLRSRARDLLVDDYDAGDAAWVTGRFQNLNAQIGSYETYDDELAGVKSFFSLSLLLRDPERSAALQSAIGGLQELEDRLPYESHRQVRSDVPVGVYQVIADFGQARGTNTATILPNESHLSRMYGRTILLRANIMTHPELFKTSNRSFEAAVHQDHHGDLDDRGNFERTLWHEIGHYLGVDRTTDGRDLGDALQTASDLLEELKSDLVSLFSIPLLLERGYHDESQARSIYASGIRRVLQKTRPHRSQPYQTMQLMQWNWYLEQGLLEFDKASQTLRIHDDHYHEAVTSLLEEVLRLQAAGDLARAEAFITRYSQWNDALHGVIATKMTRQESYRYRLVHYAALGE